MIFHIENLLKKSNFWSFLTWPSSADLQKKFKSFVFWLSVQHGTSKFVYPKMMLHNQSHVNVYIHTQQQPRLACARVSVAQCILMSVPQGSQSVQEQEEGCAHRGKPHITVLCSALHRCSPIDQPLRATRRACGQRTN